jgi:hypothetical protein
MECPKCKKTNDKEANFCCRCGIKLELPKQCPICLSEKECIILNCGHNCCQECMDKQYEIKKECPTCREKISKCEKCFSYRVSKDKHYEKCLDCNHKVKIKKIENNLGENINRVECLDCYSRRILYNHVNNSWSCLDCFRTFCIDRINNSVRIAENLQSTTTICLKCCSNELENNLGTEEINCKNCLEKNTKTKLISLEEFSRLRIKTKEELDTKIKVKVCSECKSNRIFNISSNEFLEKIYYCNNCNKRDIKIEFV